MLIRNSVEQDLRSLGRSIKAARLRRRQTAGELADRVGVSLPTYRRIERGDPSVSTGALAQTLWILGMLGSVVEAVEPQNDRFAAAVETARLPKRVRRSTTKGSGI